MGADQREFCLAVIEFLRQSPGLVGVAVLAIGSQAALVGFNSSMTFDAGACGLAVFFAGGMAAVATHRSVRAGELKICHFVIEGLPIEFDDIDRPALVISMTLLAVA